jgi:hypothetical protein
MQTCIFWKQKPNTARETVPLNAKNLCAVDAVIAESDCVDVWNLPNRVILASLPDPTVIQMMLVDRERRLLTIRNMPPEK